MTKEQVIAIATCIFGGLVFLSIGVLAFLPVMLARRSRRTAARGVGVVVGYDTEERPEAAPLYHPIVRYTDAAGAGHTATARGTGCRPFQPGEQVAILYHPDSPRWVEVAGLDGYAELRVCGWWSAAAGLGCVLMGVAIWAFRIPVR